MINKEEVAEKATVDRNRLKLSILHIISDDMPGDDRYGFCAAYNVCHKAGRIYFVDYIQLYAVFGGIVLDSFPGGGSWLVNHKWIVSQI